MKKALRETQTLRAKNFCPAADPLSGGAGPPKFNQLEMGYLGATENAGQENDGQKCNTQNALIDH